MTTSNWTLSVRFNICNQQEAGAEPACLQHPQKSLSLTTYFGEPAGLEAAGELAGDAAGC